MGAVDLVVDLESWHPGCVSVWAIVLIVAAVWVVLSVALGLLIGAVVRVRDRKEAPGTEQSGPHVADNGGHRAR